MGEYELKCIVSGVNGDKYCVRERGRSKEKEAVDLLAKVTEKGKKLVEHLITKYPDEDFAQRLKNNFNPDKISETLPTSTLTAFTVDKGVSMSLCLNKTKQNDKELIDENLLTFVFLHEICHIAYKSYGHTPEYWQLFQRILREAEKIDIYKPENYKEANKEYCGIQITDNPYYEVK
jgi:hypothetical protein